MSAGTVAVPKASNLVFLKASEVKDAWGLNLFVYGPAGSGKTTLASTAQDSPLGAPLLFLDVEGGVRSISDRDDITVFRPTTYKEIIEVCTGIRDGKWDFKTIVVDSLTEAQALGMKDLLKANGRTGAPQQQDWLQSTDQIAALVRGLRDMAQTKGTNVIFTALSLDEKNENTGAVLTRPAMTPSSIKVATGAVDALGYLTFDAKTGKRVLRFTSDGSFLAKMRQPPSGVQIPAAIESPTLVKILDILQSRTITQEGGS